MATQQTQLIQTKGIFHGLPVYPDGTPQTAIITGANGISGYYMIKALSESPQRWAKIYCLSRRPPAIEGGLPKNAEFIQCDFLKSPEEIGATLKSKGVTHVDHVFFFAYIQPPPKPGGSIWSDVDELIRVNDLILNNFLGALTHASLSPKRIMLQTGAKNYGIHTGPAKTPQAESDPRPTDEPQFYFAQEDSLSKWCLTQRETSYTIAMPSYILGAVPNAAMNAAYPLAVYCAVCKHLGEPLKFPSSFESWTRPMMQSTSKMNAYFEEWLALGLPVSETARETGVGRGGGTPGLGGKPYARIEGQGKFNIADGSPFSWEDTWPAVADWYGIPYEGPDQRPEAQYTETDLGNGPRGYPPRGKISMRFSMVQWAQEPRVRRAWGELAQQHGLLEKQLTDPERVFGFADGFFNPSFSLQFSAKKARKLGWNGFVDTEESLLEVFRELAQIKMIPPVPETRVVFD